MGEPAINERRADAHVIVYGDDAPVTAQEWHCARMVWELHREALHIEPVRGVWWCGRAKSVDHEGRSRATRANAVGAYTATLVGRMSDKIAGADEWAHHARENARRATEQAEGHEANAARLRAILAGAPDAAQGGPRG